MDGLQCYLAKCKSGSACQDVRGCPQAAGNRVAPGAQLNNGSSSEALQHRHSSARASSAAAAAGTASICKYGIICRNMTAGSVQLMPSDPALSM
mmetsp:Transcript_16313/g.29678  ORF Transcript_16313/g.29678 Transcript_16313/m.29678 type:complete len:94 (-) Transcript_16313:27-308(-)